MEVFLTYQINSVRKETMKGEIIKNKIDLSKK